jgi:[ribosomal protein S18]-alanine N-acetyltransferase
VPGWDYDNSALDTGSGLRPDLTGIGLGRQAIQTGLDFGRSWFYPLAFRVTIASFDQQAQRVVTALGFQKAGCFQGSACGRNYAVLAR